ncbi:MAG: hypothetical protein CL910_03555 [Deltaproteobacteria bacterium]|jgi:tetratricopeptide (TPR) repeat protein|nr:hypothetical protein [Deltaproteobacteria bacterium]
MRDEVLRRLSAAWAIPAGELHERVSRLQQAGSRLGLANLEGPAQALLIDETAGTPLERARAARTLAPELPAARFALARALWSDGEPASAWGEFLAGTRALSGAFEARSWVRTALLQLAWIAVSAAGLGFLLLGLAVGIPALMRRLGVFAEHLPGPARASLIGVALLLPAALGEGALGVAIVAAAAGMAAGGGARRLSMTAAGSLLLLGLFPLLDRAAEARVELANSPLFTASQRLERGVASPAERARVWRGAHENPAAGRALALEERRRGRLSAADARFETWLARDADSNLLSNAASVKMARSETEHAMALLEQAADADPADPVVLFNLSQVYGAAVRIEAQNQALAEAQAIDADRVHALTAAFGPGLIADRPIRLVTPPHETSGGRLDPALAAATLRSRLAPGRLGTSLPLAAGAFALALAVGVMLGRLLERSGGGEEDLRTRIARPVENRSGDSAERIQRLAELRAREARLARIERIGQVLVPGLAGLLAGRPWLGLAAFASAAALACSVWLDSGPVPPPLSVGPGPELLLPWLLGFGLLVYVGLTGLSMLAKERT